MESSDNSEETTTDMEGVKVPEAFQKEASALVDGLNTMPELEFLQSLISDQRSKLMSSQKKNQMNKADFSTEEMPS